MSCYEWSSGVIKLPSAEYAGVRRKVADAHTAFLEQMFAYAQTFWSSLSAKQKRDPGAYAEAVRLYVWGDYGTRKGVTDDEHMALELDWALRVGKERPKRLIRSNIDWPTNKTVSFHASDLTISFDGGAKTVAYIVSENNRARDHAQKTHLHVAFYEAMDAVKWTRSSGGVILGNDEYHREGGYEMEGGGGSYVVDAFGPVGAREAPAHVRKPFLDSSGKRMTVETKMTRTGITGKVVAYSPPPHRYGQSYGYPRGW